MNTRAYADCMFPQLLQTRQSFVTYRFVDHKYTYARQLYVLLTVSDAILFKHNKLHNMK